MRVGDDDGTSLRGALAIVGIGETEVGALHGRGATETCVEAGRRALVDAGIDKGRIDGLITCNPWVERHLYHAEMVSEYMQIFPRYAMTLNAGGATCFSALHHAASAIVTGLCDTVLISAGDTPRTGLSPDATLALVSSTLHQSPPAQRASVTITQTPHCRARPLPSDTSSVRSSS